MTRGVSGVDAHLAAIGMKLTIGYTSGVVGVTELAPMASVPYYWAALFMVNSSDSDFEADSDAVCG